MSAPFYQLSAKSLQGHEISMETYQGKVILIVNTASKCGFTPQYEGLETLYSNYKNQGFVILGFPCNQFGNQEPGNETQIAEGCLVNYGVTFPMFSKVNVNGKESHPVYQYLKNSLSGWFGKSVKWNFTKFLLDASGKPIKRFPPTTKPEEIEKYVVELLNRKG